MIRSRATAPLALALVGVLALVPGAARADIFSCKPDDPRTAGNWIAPEVVVSHEAGATTALVNDGVIATSVGRPVEADVETDNARRTTFSWRVKTEAGTQSATMVYRLTIQKADLSASFVAVPQGYSNTFQVQGQCRRVTG